MARRLLMFAAASGLMLVMLGAFGAHALEHSIPTSHLIWWQKAVHYQGLHTLALFGVAILAMLHSSRPLHLAGWLFIAGMALFSGSLYLMALTDLRALAWLTPIGGISFIAGWFALLTASWRLPH
ncbi:MAG: DUF423 domain-containing protein [Candidatus Thiodiazotropha sp.]|jgi:uncharacterized membrane protein YgdD (TMEM256/DUF423 family)